MRELTDQRKTKSEVVYNRLYSDILSGQLKPKTKINLKSLCEQFNMSEIPIREALHRLASEEILKYEHYIGYTVPILSVKQLSNIWEIKVVLEGLAAQRALENCKEKDLKVLYQILQESEDLLKAHQNELYHDLNKKFHMTLYGISGNKELCKLISNYWNRTDKWLRSYPYYDDAYIRKSIGEHQKMIDAIIEKDKDQLVCMITTQRAKNWSAFMSLYQNMSLLFEPVE